jgi:endonuclease-3
MDYKKNIELIMQILEKFYNHKERTTLNRMRCKKMNDKQAFKILISCLLSLRTQDKNTEKASNALFAVADTPKEIIKIPVRKLEKIIFSSGHYRKKTKVIKHISKEIIEKFNGKVPKTREELLSIKGIGPKTANIVLAFAFNIEALPIDTHCHRIPNRMGWFHTITPEKTETELEKILPKKYWKEFNGIFVLFGKTICQPISPWCSKCPINKYCPKIGVIRRR